MSDNRGRYRKVRCLIWTDPAFLSLSAFDQRTAFYVLTGPQSNSIGLHRFSLAAAAEDVGADITDFRTSFQTVIKRMLWRFDPEARVLWIPSWIEDNEPQSPNVVKSWRSVFNEVPACDLKAEAAAQIVRFLGMKGKAFMEAFGKGLPEAFAQPSLNQEQEQQQEAVSGNQEQPQDKTYRAPRSDEGPFDRFWAAYPRRIAKAVAAKAFAALNVDDALLGNMLSALRWQTQNEQWLKDGGAFIPHPATWLRARRWEDERPAQSPKASQGTSALSEVLERSTIKRADHVYFEGAELDGDTLRLADPIKANWIDKHLIHQFIAAAGHAITVRPFSERTETGKG